MIDHLTLHFNLKSMASIDTCQSRATYNVSSQARTLSSPTEEPPNTKQSCRSLISPGTKGGKRERARVISHPAVLFLAAVTESVRCSLVIKAKDGLQQMLLMLGEYNSINN